MDKITEYLKKIVKKANDPQAYYTCGVEYRSTLDKPLYMINIVWTKQGLTPLRLTSYTKAELLEQLKKYHRDTKASKLNVMYHQNQIDASKLVIKHHEQMLKAYE